MNDGENLTLTGRGSDFVDSANQEFYSRFPFPWPPMTFPELEDPSFETVMLNQSFGDFTLRTVPVDANVWVAGCGTNQAVYTALRFPKATVIGSDLSPSSLEMSKRNAQSLGIRNLTLNHESLNDVTYAAQFDYILCTGVIHHNADPAKPLARIASALRPNGVLELMVYNRFHRAFNVGFQKAVKLVAHHMEAAGDYARELEIAKALVRSPPMASSPHGAEMRDGHDAFVADALIQPVEYSYTVESLAALLAECGLELVLPCSNQFDATANRSWDIEFSTRELQEAVDTMPDVARWQLSNLLLLGSSPMLWFYVRHRQNQHEDRYEARVNEAFLDQRFVSAKTTLSYFVRGSDFRYTRASASAPYPPAPANSLIRDITSRATGRLTMREILEEVGTDTTSRKAVASIRTRTTTAFSPFLRAV